MWHTAFNFGDYRIQLRLLALAATFICLVYLGIWEFASRIGHRQALLLSLVIVFASATVALALTILNGVA